MDAVRLLSHYVLQVMRLRLPFLFSTETETGWIFSSRSEQRHLEMHNKNFSVFNIVAAFGRWKKKLLHAFQMWNLAETLINPCFS